MQNISNDKVIEIIKLAEEIINQPIIEQKSVREIESRLDNILSHSNADTSTKKYFTRLT